MVCAKPFLSNLNKILDKVEGNRAKQKQKFQFEKLFNEQDSKSRTYSNA